LIFLFSENELNPEGRRFESIEGSQAKSQDVMKMLTRNDFCNRLRSWKSHYDRCIKAEGDYFEGDGGE
jgi:hypothetical protein